MARKRLESGDLKNLRMDADVYALRRKVIEIIYDAKRLIPSLPRVEVRITDNHECILGQGTLGGRVIWITKRVISDPRFSLRRTVYHELVHAVGGIGHDESCPLMSPCHQAIDRETADRCLVKWLGTLDKERLAVV